MSSTETEHNHVLDARDIDGEPFGDIMAALQGLEDGETLLLVNSFEPVPLSSVLSDRGFEHESMQVSETEWHVDISHE